MFLHTIKSEGLAHLSYILGDGDQAVVIDPRRDCQVYLEEVAREGMQIVHIFETHRNEDYVIGSKELADLSGAVIHHGKALDFQYGEAVSEGDQFEVGDLQLEILETPGHTMESISIVVRDRNFGDTPVAVFTGDALFIGDVGRTDFFPDRAREVSGMLYDSIFEKLLPLGDQALLFPAHGAGSVCGDNMAKREFSSIGYEKRNNPALQVQNRDDFIDRKINEHHDQPAYFRRMEQYNLEGAPPLHVLKSPPPMSAGEVADRVHHGAVLVDLRSPEAFAGAFIPGSLAIPLEMIPAYAGYLLEYDWDVILIPETVDQIATAFRYLVRMGYDRIPGYLKGGMHAWEISGGKYERIGAVHANALTQRIESGETFTLLDVRKKPEFEAGHVKNARHIFLGELQDRLNELDRGQSIVTFCGSGQRAIIAASILKRHGFEDVSDSLGSMAACRKSGCPMA